MGEMSVTRVIRNVVITCMMMIISSDMAITAEYKFKLDASMQRPRTGNNFKFRLQFQFARDFRESTNLQISAFLWTDNRLFSNTQ